MLSLADDAFSVLRRRSLGDSDNGCDFTGRIAYLLPRESILKDSRSKHYLTLAALDETGYVVLDPCDQSNDPPEWLELDFLDGQWLGATRVAPLASAYGDLECEAFSKHRPPKPDKDGVWVQGNAAKAPRLVARAEEPGANIGRCRVIELQPNSNTVMPHLNGPMD